MILPLHVVEIIKAHIAASKTTDLQKARVDLSEAYKAPTHSKKRIVSPEQNLSYLATRMPATYAVCWTVLQMLQKQGFSPTSLLDVCAGPGTATLACSEIFQALESVHLLDYDAFFKETAQAFLLPYPYARTYMRETLSKQTTVTSADLVMVSYGLNEWPEKDKKDILSMLWQSTKKVLVLIEPGTPRGFENIREARSLLIQAGAKVIAPCTHENACPMAGKDWCHFSVRLPRAPFHQRIKDSHLNYEDEKYSYVILSKEMGPHPEARIIKRVIHNSGHVILDTCTAEGLKRTVVSKQAKDLYRQARKAEWGDGWPPQEKG